MLFSKYRATWYIFQSKLEKKNPSRKNFLHFRDWNFLAPRLTTSLYFRKLNFLIFYQKKAFLVFREVELFYISRNGNPEKIPYISDNATFQYFLKRRPRNSSLYFRKRILSYISGKVYSEPWHNGTFLYFWKSIFRTLA